MNVKLVLAGSALALVAAVTVLGIREWNQADPGEVREAELTLDTDVDPLPTANETEAEPPSVAAADSPSLSTPDGARRQPLDFELEVRHADGRLAPGARVVLFHGTAVVAGRETDSRGIARLPSPPPGSEIAVLAEGAPLLREALVEVEPRTTVQLSEGTEVSGWLIVDGQEPEETVPLQLVPQGGWVAEEFLTPDVWKALGTRHDAPRSTTTTKGGFFRFAGLSAEWPGAGIPTPPGLLARFEEELEGEVGRLQTRVEGPTSHSVLECFHKVHLRLRIVNADGSTPDPGVRVEIDVRVPAPFHSGTILAGADKTGRLDLQLDPVQARARLVARFTRDSGAGWFSHPLSWLEIDREGICDLGDLSFPPLIRVRFVIVDELEQPVKGARVTQRKVTPDRGPVISSPTNEAGETALEIDPRLGSAQVEASGFCREAVRIEDAREGPIVVKLRRATTLFISLTAVEELSFEKMRIEITTTEPLFPETRGWAPGDGNVVLGSIYNMMWDTRENGGIIQLHPDAEGRLQLSDLLPNMPMTIRVLDEDDEALGTVEVPALWDGENRIVEIDLAKH